MSDDRTVGDLIRPYVAEQCRVICDALAPLRAGEPVVHRTRVAVRRLRSTVRVFADAFEPAAVQKLETELVWLAGALGEVRDLDILGERLADRLQKLPAELVMGPVASTIQTEIALRRKERWAELMAAFDSERWTDLTRVLARWEESPPLTEAAQAPALEAKRYVRKADKKLAKRLKAALAAYDEGSPDAEELLHAARKAGKRHRYAVELMEPLWGSKSTKIVAHRKELQDVLGEHQDSHVSAEFLRGAGARFGNRSGGNGFTYGLLYGAELGGRKGLPDRLRKLLN